MKRTFLSGKIHRAVVTGVDIEYEGSIAIDEDLMTAAGLMPYERVDIYNITNGERFSTYAIKAAAGSGDVLVYGAAGRKAQPGDIVIIAAYAELEEEEYEFLTPKIVFVGPANKIRETR